MRFQKILFPTDFSEGSASALKYAADMARTYGARLYLLHVIYDIASASGLHVPHISVDDMYKEFESEAKKEIER
ncbi:MAG: universal stress protein, partial [Nitrospirae bacterium]|nr:universal stress protein [Nitrospirota bacterium]